MTQYAYFDSTASQPTPVIGWFDTGALSYPNLPNSADLLQLTSVQWNERLTGGPWGVQNNQLVSYTPTPTLAQQSATALGEQIAAGIAIVSTSNPTGLNATYALDPLSQNQIYQIGLYAQQFGAFPGGASEQYYPDATSAPHIFNVTQYVSFLQAVATYVAALNAQAGIIKEGGSPSWPSSPVTIA